MKKQLPIYFKHILWSYNFSKIDPVKDKKIIILNTVNYGDFTHWHWIKQFYGEEAIKAILAKVPGTAIRARAKRLASIMFNIKSYSNAPRGIEHKR